MEEGLEVDRKEGFIAQGRWVALEGTEREISREGEGSVLWTWVLHSHTQEKRADDS